MAASEPSVAVVCPDCGCLIVIEERFLRLALPPPPSRPVEVFRALGRYASDHAAYSGIWNAQHGRVCEYKARP
jgi:hypothetical protein